MKLKRLTREQRFNSVLASLGFALASLGFALNIAVSIAATDPRLPRFAPLAEYAIVIIGVLMMVGAAIRAVILQCRSQKPPDKARLEELTSVVARAELTLGPDPELKEEEHWESLLGYFEGIGQELVDDLVFTKPQKEGQLSKKIRSQEAADLLIRLILLLIFPMRRHGQKHQEILLELTTPGYQAAMLLKRWENAARIAYHATFTKYDLSSQPAPSEGKVWIHRMEDSTKNLDLEDIQYQSLKAMQLQLQALRCRDYFPVDRDKARTHFNEALLIARNLGDFRMLGKIYAQFGDLEQMVGNLRQAADYYTQGRDKSKLADDIERQLDCIDKLGSLAQAGGDYNRAYTLYDELLNLSAGSLGSRNWERKAHEGIANACTKKAENLQKIAYPTENDYELAKEKLQKDAYQHIRHALHIEENISPISKDANILRTDVIKRADILLKPVL